MKAIIEKCPKFTGAYIKFFDKWKTNFENKLFYTLVLQNSAVLILKMMVLYTFFHSQNLK